MYTADDIPDPDEMNQRALGFTCQLCGAVVQRFVLERHAEWHNRVEGLTLGPMPRSVFL